MQHFDNRNRQLQRFFRQSNFLLPKCRTIFAAMKKFYFLAAILILIAALLWFKNVQIQKANSTLDENSIDFSIDNPDEIQALYLTNKIGKSIRLEKKGDSWILNGEYPAWQKQIDVLLYQTMPKLSIKGVVHKNARKNVIGRMASTGVKVEIFEKIEDNPYKVYYVGGTTPDNLGTYYWMEGSDNPMIVELPGHDGFLNSRYDLNVDNWISRSVFTASKEEIARVGIEYPANPRHSFDLKIENDELQLSQSFDTSRSPNAGALRSYLNLFEKLNFESFADYSKKQSDSIRTQTPLAIIYLNEKNGDTDTLTIFPKGSYDGMKGLYDKDGNRLAYDPTRFFAKWSKLERLLIIQDYTFGKVLLRAEDFINRI